MEFTGAIIEDALVAIFILVIGEENAETVQIGYGNDLEARRSRL